MRGGVPFLGLEVQGLLLSLFLRDGEQPFGHGGEPLEGTLFFVGLGVLSFHADSLDSTDADGLTTLHGRRYSVVGRAGFEPARVWTHRGASSVRLPFSPPAQCPGTDSNCQGGGSTPRFVPINRGQWRAGGAPYKERPPATTPKRAHSNKPKGLPLDSRAATLQEGLAVRYSTVKVHAQTPVAAGVVCVQGSLLHQPRDRPSDAAGQGKSKVHRCHSRATVWRAPRGTSHTGTARVQGCTPLDEPQGWER